MATLNGKTPQAIAKAIIDESNAAASQQELKIKAIAEKLQLTYERAQALVEGEQKRVEAGRRYRQSASYKAMLERQKVVRAMLRSN